MFNSIMGLMNTQYDFFLGLLFTHIKISLLVTAIAGIIGLAIGIFISKRPKAAAIILNIVNIIYTIPSIALLGILISYTGIGNTTAIIALTLYALMPMVRNTYTGINNIDPRITEAAYAMGSNEKEVLFKISLPLAAPVILSGFRNMVTMTIALATIASFVGAGGLGVSIYRGITTGNNPMILVGSVLVALLAISADLLISRYEKKLAQHKKPSKVVIVLLGAALLFSVFRGAFTQEINVASKPTTEGIILAEMMEILIEEKTDLDVKHTSGVAGGTGNIHPAMMKGDFDMYAEYTGTIWQVVIKETQPYDESKFQKLNDKYKDMYDMEFHDLYGFNNTYGIAIREDLAKEYNIKTYSDLATHSHNFVFGAEYDFYEREDGYPNISKEYGFNFKEVLDMDIGLKYQAMKDGKIDVMVIFTTDGQLTDSDVVVLEDDKKFYPSYMGGTAVRRQILRDHPELVPVLRMLNGIISDKEMAEMNYQVETLGRKPSDVAREFLEKEGIL